MSWTDTIDRAYARTMATPEEEAATECQRKDCDATYVDTKACGICEARFCPLHLYGGFCAECFAVDEAAEELERAA